VEQRGPDAAIMPLRPRRTLIAIKRAGFRDFFRAADD
jgi:hypothetical protein